MIDPTNAQYITKDFFIWNLYSENIFDQVDPTEQVSWSDPLCTENGNFGQSYYSYFCIDQKILASFGAYVEVPQHATCQVESPKHGQVTSLMEFSLASHGTCTVHSTRWNPFF